RHFGATGRRPCARQYWNFAGSLARSAASPTGTTISLIRLVLQAEPGHSVTNTTTWQAPLLLATHSKRARSRQVRTQLFSTRAPSSTERATVMLGTCSQAVTPAANMATRRLVNRTGW